MKPQYIFHEILLFCMFELTKCSHIVHADGDIKFQFSIVDEVDSMIDSEYQKPLEFLDIPNNRLAEQLTFKDAVSK